ncbi:MAG TPA: acetate--CoA ligase family protein [Acidimicrobiales bacterium]|nr:acetate--CoA ligase family protein [Acidimicrobiales bacterium]
MRAERIAVVGASTRQFFAYWTIQNLRAFQFEGDIWPVHPAETEVLGHPTWPSIEALPAAPDLAVVAIRASACPGAVRRLRARGCETVVVLSDGFAETGTQAGMTLQHELVEAAGGATLIGPNAMGVADFHAGMVAVGGPLARELRPGSVSIVTHSGGLLSAILSGLGTEGLGADLCISVGNGAAFGLLDGIEACAARDTTETVAVYMEGLGDDAPRLGEVLDRAGAAGKRVVVLNPGRSEAALAVVESHTARLVGPHDVAEALLRRHGALVVEDLQTLVRVAHLAPAVDGRARGGAVAVVGSSGGAAGLAADLAHRSGLPLADYDQTTRTALARLVPSSGTIGNPMDLSGGSADVAAALETVGRDPAVGVLLLVFPAPFPDDSPERESHRQYLETAAAAAAASGTPIVVSSLVAQKETGWCRAFAARYGHVRVVQEIGATCRALAALLGSAAGQPSPPSLTSRTHQAAPGGGAPLSEAGGRELLVAAGLSVVPGHVCRTEEELPAATRRLGFPLVVKAVLPGVAHKARIGGVTVGLCNDEAVVTAGRQVRDACAAAGVVAEGFLVEEMVTGTELLVGLTRDVHYGPAVTVGVGGDLAETGIGHATEVLPLGGEQAGRRLLASAGLVPALAGWGPAGNGLISYLLRLCDAFTTGNLASFSAVEINPLFVTAEGRVLAGDVLVYPP